MTGTSIAMLTLGFAFTAAWIFFTVNYVGMVLCRILSALDQAKHRVVQVNIQPTAVLYAILCAFPPAAAVCFALFFYFAFQDAS